MTEEKKSAKDKVSDGIKQGIGVLSAFKEALEETIQEAKGKGDLSTERAKDVLRDALEKAQSAAGDAKDRLDYEWKLVSQKEFDGLQGVVETIEDRVAALETHLGFGGGDDDGAEPETEEEDAPKAADGDDAGKNAAAGEDDSADHDQATEDASE
ncbi:MAG TPA: hypothetical protein EYQ27_00830 [Gemmatimonadetes bacterium]|nr:hypothetical protein [Gemmatimonadota bacterium]